MPVDFAALRAAHQFRADLIWLTQLRESQGLGPRVVANGHQPKGTVAQPPSNGNSLVSEASEVGTAGNNYGNKSHRPVIKS